MSKKLRDILVGTDLVPPRSNGGEERFIAKHKVAVQYFVDDKEAETNQPMFDGSNVDTYKRQPMHGYDPGEDKKVYEGKGLRSIIPVEEGSLVNKIKAAGHAVLSTGLAIKHAPEVGVSAGKIIKNTYKSRKNNLDRIDRINDIKNKKVQEDTLDEGLLAKAARAIRKHTGSQRDDLRRKTGDALDDRQRKLFGGKKVREIDGYLGWGPGSKKVIKAVDNTLQKDKRYNDIHNRYMTAAYPETKGSRTKDYLSGKGKKK